MLPACASIALYFRVLVVCAQHAFFYSTSNDARHRHPRLSLCHFSQTSLSHPEKFCSTGVLRHKQCAEPRSILQASYPSDDDHAAALNINMHAGANVLPTKLAAVVLYDLDWHAILGAHDVQLQRHEHGC